MAVPDKAEATGPWDNPALATVSRMGPGLGRSMPQDVQRPVDQRRTAAQRRRADQPCGECCLYELERRAEPAAIFAAHSKPARPAKRS